MYHWEEVIHPTSKAGKLANKLLKPDECLKQINMPAGVWVCCLSDCSDQGKQENKSMTVIIKRNKINYILGLQSSNVTPQSETVDGLGSSFSSWSVPGRSWKNTNITSLLSACITWFALFSACKGLKYLVEDPKVDTEAGLKDLLIEGADEVAVGRQGEDQWGMAEDGWGLRRSVACCCRQGGQRQSRRTRITITKSLKEKQHT